MNASVTRHRQDTVRPPLTLKRLQLPILSFVTLVLFAVALLQTGVSPSRFAGSVDSVRSLLGRMWPPVTFEWPRYLAAVLVTFHMVVAATGLAVILSIPLAVLSTRHTTSHRATRVLARGLLVFARAVPSIVWALLLIRAIGIGPLAGVLAMGISSTGMLGKLFADTIEEADLKPAEALSANGSSRLQVFFGGILPQVMPAWTSLTLFRVDINVRRSVILGFVGAGGIGFELQRVLGQLVYPRGLTIVAMIFVFILAVEQLSGWVRKVLVGSEGLEGIPFLRHRREKVAPTVGGTTTLPPGVDLSMLVNLPWTSARRVKLVAAVVAVVLVIFSMVQVGLGPVSFVTAWIDLLGVAQRMWPPDFVTNWEGIAAGMLETFWIALAATVLGMGLALPVAILAARNISPRPWISRLARLTMLVQRGIPELIVAVLLVAAVGLGPFAGILALTLGAIGFTGKLLADGLETLPDQGRVGLESVGAGWCQRVAGAVVPQAMPMIVGLGVYTLDVYVRAAAILGIVGAGGIGGILNSTLQSHSYDRTLAICLIVFVLIYGFERLSGWARKRVT